MADLEELGVTPPAQPKSIRLLDQDGGEYDVPEHEVPGALKSGLIQPSGRTVKLTDDKGGEYEVPEELAPEAMKSGLKQSWADKAIGAAEALGRGVTGGLSDLARTASEAAGAALTQGFARGEGFKVDEDAGKKAALAKSQELQARAERTGGLATGLETAGAVVPALLSGGTSGAAQVARYTPPGAISSLAARAAGAFGGETAAKRIGQAAAAGALESAMQSAQRRVVDDLTQGNYQISAERMAPGLWSVVQDAAIGGAIGGAAGGLIEGSTAAARAAKKGFGRLAPAETAPVKPTTYNLEEAILDPVSAAEKAAPLTTEELGQVADNLSGGVPSDALRAARGAADAFGDTQQGAVKSISKNLEGFARLQHEVRETASLEAKRDFIRNMPPVALQTDTILGQLDNTARLVSERLDNIPAPALDGGGGTALARVKEMAAHTRGRIANAESPADAIIAADEFKSFLQRAQNVRNPMVQDTLRKEAENWRLFIEDPNIFGEFGRVQAKLNRPIYEGIAAENDDAIRAYFKRGSEQSAFDPFEVLKRPNEQHIGGVLNGLGKAEAAADEAAFRKFLRLKVIDAQTRAEIYGSARLKQVADDLGQHADNIENAMNAVGLASRDRQAWQKLKDALPIAGNLAAPAKGLRAVGSAISRMAKHAAEVEHASAQAADDVVRGLSGRAARVGAVAGASETAIRRALEQAQELQDPDSPASARLRLTKEELAADDPAFADQAVQAAQAKADFLAQKAGPTEAPPDGPWGGQARALGRSEQAVLARYTDAAVKPAGALRRLASGQGSAEDIETLRTLYPALYQDFVERTMQKVLARKEKPTTRQRQHLARITGIPMGRLMTPESTLWFQEQGNVAPEPAQPAQQQTPSRGPTDPDSVAVRSDRILTGGM